MKKLFLIFVFLIYCNCQLKNDFLEQTSDIQKQFNYFLVHHNKNYIEDEYDKKIAIFTENKDKIDQLNDYYGDDVVFTINQFSDLSSDEFKNTILMGQIVQDQNNEPQNFAPFITQKSTPPQNLDMKYATTPVKNQGSCGSCWAFSVAQDIESRWFLATNKLYELSVQQIIECDPLDTACYGGWTYNGFQYVIDNGGLTESSNYPYNVKGHVICLANQTFNQTCPIVRDPPCTFFCDLTCQEQHQKVVKIDGYLRIPQDEDQMKLYLIEKGPYSILIDADGLQHYKKGIYNGGLFGRCGTVVDHAVLLVGYGTYKGKDYWLVKNSWGEAWGEEGYFRITRGSNKCNIKQYPMFSIVKSKKKEIEI